MLSRFLAVAALAALAACSGSPVSPEPSLASIADGYQLATVNGRPASDVQPLQYYWRAEGDTLETLTQVTGGVACVAVDGQFDMLRVVGSARMTRAGEFLPSPVPSGFVDTRGTWTAIGDGAYRLTGTIVQNDQRVEYTATRAGLYLTVDIPAERATYKFAAAGPGSPMRENCRRAGFNPE